MRRLVRSGRRWFRAGLDGTLDQTPWLICCLGADVVNCCDWVSLLRLIDLWEKRE